MGSVLSKIFGTGTAGSITTKTSTNLVEQGDHNNVRDIKQCSVTAAGNAKVKVHFESNADELGSCRTEDVTTSDLKRRLKEWYSDLQLPVITWMRRGNFPLEDYYFPLQLNSVRRASSIEDATGNAKSKTRGTSDALKREIPISQLSVMDNVKFPTNLTNIFDAIEGDDPKRIFIESQPGLGKTTLAHKIMRDWQKGENYTARFDLAMLIPLRYLRGKSLRDMVLEILKANDDAANVWKLINSDRMLLVLDGLDEVGESAREDVLKVLYDKIDFKMTILVTCRTGLFELENRERDSLFSGVAKGECFWDKKIEILGFDDESRRKFVDKFITLENKVEILDKITEVIKPMKDLLQSPLILILLVYILLDDETFTIKTITELYKKLVDFIIKRSVNRDKHSEIDEKFTLFNKALRRDYHVNFCKFGERSRDRILNDNMQFECDELTELIYRMGFLMKHETRKINFKVLPHYESCHLTFLEFAAAYSLWDRFHSNGNEFTDETLHKINEICLKKRSVSMILPFLCGLLRSDVKKLFHQLHNFRALYSMDEHLMKSILRECEASDDVCKILAHFIPKLVSGWWYEILFLRNKILTNYIVLLDVTCPHLQMLLQLGKLHVETIYVSMSTHNLPETSKSTSKVSCKNLFINVAGCCTDSYYSVAGQLIFLLNGVSCRCKHLRMETQCDKALINECVENNIFRDQTLDTLFDYLTTEQISGDLIINIIKHNIVKRLEIFVESESNFNNLYKILEIGDSTSNILSSVLIFTQGYPNAKFDLSNALNNGEKCWRYFGLKGINVGCSVSLTNNECIESFDITWDSINDVKILYALKPKKLRCDYRLYDRLMVDPNLLSWDGFQSVTNLCLVIIQNRFQSLETLSRIGKFTSLKKVALCLDGSDDLDQRQQRNVIKCLKLLTVDKMQFFCTQQCLVTDVVNGIKNLLGKRELTSIRNIDFKFFCGGERRNEDEYLKFLSALRIALLSDIRVTAQFTKGVGGEARFQQLFTIFYSSQLEIQEIATIPTYLKFRNWYCKNVLKIRKKNISED